MKRRDKRREKNNVSATIYGLNLGPLENPPTEQEMQVKREKLKATVEHYFPEVMKEVEKQKKEEKPVFMFHQDAFAGAYQYDEYTGLGMVIKYAGLFGVNLLIVGRNEETFSGTKVPKEVNSFSSKPLFGSN